MTRLLLPALVLAATSAAGAQLEDELAGDELPLGIEVVTGYYSEYVHRGFELAPGFLDVQAEAQVALSDEWLLNFGASYGAATGNGDFTETVAFVDLRYETDRWTAAMATTWRDYRDSFFKDGFDLAPSFMWHLTEDWDIESGVAYDTGDSGWYSHLEARWSHPTGKSSFISAEAGSSWTSDYYGSSGWHDIYTRVGWTYAFNRSVSVTPFLGASIPASSGPERNRVFGGVWFEVNF